MRGDAEVGAQLIGPLNHFADLLERRVTILLNQMAVRRGELIQVGRIDDQFPALFNDAAEFVAGLSANPQLIVMFVEQRHHALVLAPGIFDVHAGAHCGGASQ